MILNKLNTVLHRRNSKCVCIIMQSSHLSDSIPYRRGLLNWWRRTNFYIGKEFQFSKIQRINMIFLIYEHLNILLILHCLEYAPLDNFWTPPGAKSFMYMVNRYMNKCLRSSLELQCSIYDTTMKSTCYKRDLMFNIRISGEQF